MNSEQKILVYLPSPLGDAIMSTSALAAIRDKYKNAEIYYLATSVVQKALTPCDHCNGWVDTNNKSFLKTIQTLKQHRFTHAVLMKNSFQSALICKLAGIKNIKGYAREFRSVFLTEKLLPKKINGKFQPAPMPDYYMALVGIDQNEEKKYRMNLQLAENDKIDISEKFKQYITSDKPFIIFVPGGAFGPSKFWPADYFASLANMLTDKYQANIIISVAPNKNEIALAQGIRMLAKNDIKSLADTPLSMGQLKALYSHADLVITNDTGPRHIAIALDKNVISIFGPNNPKWTDSKHTKEVQIFADVPCAGCHNKECPLENRLCMESITPQMVFNEATKMLSSGNNK